MSEPITIEQVQQECKNHPCITPFEHIANLVEQAERAEQNEEREGETK